MKARKKNQEPPVTFRNLREAPETSRNFQEAPGTSKNLLEPSGTSLTLREPQVISQKLTGTPENLQEPFIKGAHNCFLTQRLLKCWLYTGSSTEKSLVKRQRKIEVGFFVCICYY